MQGVNKKYAGLGSAPGGDGTNEGSAHKRPDLKKKYAGLSTVRTPEGAGGEKEICRAGYCARG